MIDVEISAGVAWVTLGRAPVNALDEAMVDLLDSAVGEVRRNDGVRVMVVRSDGRIFCAGADIAMMSKFLETEGGPQRLVAYAERLQGVLSRIAALPIPTIAEVGGAALGGGLELALSCDIRIVAAGVRLGMPEANIGLLPGAGGTQRLSALAGAGFAIKAITSGELFDAAEAFSRGIVTEVVPTDGLGERVRELAAELASRELQTLLQIKRCVTAAGSAAGFAAELDATRILAAQPSTLGAMKAFLNSRRHKETV